MAKKDMLKKMKMPEAPAKDDMLELEEADLALGSEAPEMAEEMPEEEMKMEKESSELEAIEDDDLIAELEKRGFQIAPKEEEEAEEISMESEEEPA